MHSRYDVGAWCAVSVVVYRDGPGDAFKYGMVHRETSVYEPGRITLVPAQRNRVLHQRNAARTLEHTNELGLVCKLALIAWRYLNCAARETEKSDEGDESDGFGATT